MHFDNAKNLFQLQIELIDGKIENKIRKEIRNVMDRIDKLEEAMNQRIKKLEYPIKSNEVLKITLIMPS